MNCKKCAHEVHEDSQGIVTCLSCGYREEINQVRDTTIYSNKDLMKRESTNDAGEKLQSTEDSINPNHYTSFTIAPNEYITANELEWEVGNVVKYVSRYHLKNGKEDLLKAIKYIELLIERKYDES